MVTLTGFDDSQKRRDEWEAYIDRLIEKRRGLRETYTALRGQQDDVSRQKRLKAYSRYDLLSEHLMRAIWEVEGEASDKAFRRYMKRRGLK